MALYEETDNVTDGVSVDDYYRIIVGRIGNLDNHGGERVRNGNAEATTDEPSTAPNHGQDIQGQDIQGQDIPHIMIRTPTLGLEERPSVDTAPHPAPDQRLAAQRPPRPESRVAYEPPPTREDVDWSSVGHYDKCLNADDAYSVAESHVRESNMQPSWARARQNDGHGGSDEDSLPGGRRLPDDELYDSDLDSQPDNPGNVKREHHKKMQRWRGLASNRYERMLLECIVNIDSIPPDYQNIHVDRAIIDRLEQVTSLSLRRTRAFDHGVLRDNKITGAVLYGPPGTGKTLLAKSLARTSHYNMLATATSELWQKCHGEDEKVIKAVFSLGRKMHPCIIFLDEADAMLGARKAGEKRHIRSMISQFLQEWDGLGSGGKQAPFLLLATNRPFDLDPAVLRRAPVQIELGMPGFPQRQGILQLLLGGEKLDDGVNCAQLAAQTHGYSGSDLKNMCVQAATLAVSEQKMDTHERVLTQLHFHRALKMIRPVALTATMRNEFARFGRQEVAGTGGEAEE